MFSLYTSYKHSPLRAATEPGGEFRLLTILPSPAKGKIKCTLQNASLSNPPRYEALSYTWGNPKGAFSEIPAKGDPTRLFGIRIGRKRAKVTYNLHAALLQLRHKSTPRVIWIDALCIDQTNGAEKSEQVRLMAKLYGQASRVLVWLGEDDSFVDTAFDMLEQLFWSIKVAVWQHFSWKLGLPLSEITEDMVAPQLALDIENDVAPEAAETLFPIGLDISALLKALSLVSIDFSTENDPALMAVHTFGKDSLPGHMFLGDHKLSEHHDWQKMIHALFEVFFYRNYWSRLWVLQEMVSATEVDFLCGGRQIDFLKVKIIHAAFHMRSFETGNVIMLKIYDSDAARDLAASLYTVCIPQHLKIHPRTCYRAWKSGTDRFCSEPRDYIYAWLNIVQPIEITVDYSKSIVDIYSEATMSIIKQEGNLNVVYDKANRPLPDEGSLPGQMVQGLPSWVPNYAAALDNWDLFNPFLSSARQNYRGGGPMKVQSSAGGGCNNKSLEISGSFCGKIANVSTRIPTFADEFEMLKMLEQFRSSLSVTINSRTSSENLAEEEFWRTMVGDCYYGLSPSDLVRIGWNNDARSSLQHDINLAKVSSMPKRMSKTIMRILHGAILCTTTRGSLAIVQGDVHVGDDVFIARGATLPLIIRTSYKDQGANTVDIEVSPSSLYRFIGGSYVHESMDGQILEEREADGIADNHVILI